MNKLPQNYLVLCSNAEEMKTVAEKLGGVKNLTFDKPFPIYIFVTKNEFYGWNQEPGQSQNNSTYGEYLRLQFDEWQKLSTGRTWKVGDIIVASGITEYVLLADGIIKAVISGANYVGYNDEQIDEYIASGEWKLKSTEPKQEQIQKTNMKPFTVQGSKYLKEAFLNEIESIGFKSWGDSTKSVILEDGLSIAPAASLRSTYISIDGTGERLIYNLPQDYNTALQAFKESNKPGDWITIIQGSKNWVTDMNECVGKTVQISSVDNGGRVRFLGDGGWIWRLSDEHFRTATEEEIKEAQKPKSIQVQVDSKNGKFPAEVFKDKVVAAGTNIQISDIRAIVDHMKTSPRVGPWTTFCTTVTIDCREGVSYDSLLRIIYKSETL